MALKVELKPGEKIILGGSVITNGPNKARLFIDGDAPILRERDILTPETATTPARRIYLAVQLMYLSADPMGLKNDYLELVKDFLEAVPSSKSLVDAVNKEILTGNFYKALKATQALIAYEGGILDHAQCSARLRGDGPEDSQSA